MRYIVSVEKRLYVTGKVTISGVESPEQAEQFVSDQIDRGELQPDHVTWGEPTAEEGSFAATGDVDEA